MDQKRTTRCCSAIALTLLCGCASAAAPPFSPLSFFPARTVWTLELNNSLKAPPAVTSDSAYFPIEGDRLVAYDLSSGTQRWIVAADVRFQPATGDGLVFIAEPQTLTALRQADGSRQWQLPFTESLAIPLVWDNEWLVAADTSGGVSAFRAVDGRLIWNRSIGAQAHARPVLSGDRLYVPTLDGRLVALLIESGAVLWEHRFGGAPNEALVLDDRIYVGADDNFFYCLRADKGEVLWRWRTGADIVGAPVADEDRVYFVSLDNVLRALGRKSGSQVWKKTLPLRPIAGPLRTADALIVAGLSPTLRAFETREGAQVAEVAMAGEMAAPPALVVPPGPSGLSAPGGGLPLLLVVTRDIAKGASAALLTRAVEPELGSSAPLPSSLVTIPDQPAPTK